MRSFQLLTSLIEGGALRRGRGESITIGLEYRILLFPRFHLSLTSFYCSINNPAYPKEVFIDLLIRKSYNLNKGLLQDNQSFEIIRFSVLCKMLASINLDNEQRLRTVEINNESTDNLLPLEPYRIPG